MKLQYVVPLEILRLMGSVMQIFDTKNTYKTVLECEKFRKGPNEKQRRIVKRFICNESSRRGDSKTGFRKTNGQDLGGV